VAIERLEHVVDRIDLEGVERVILVGGNEHDQRRRPLRQAAQHVETALATHLHIQQHQVGPQIRDHLNGLFAVRAFADDFDVEFFAAQLAQALPGGVFVIDDECANPRLTRLGGMSFGRRQGRDQLVHGVRPGISRSGSRCSECATRAQESPKYT
jgi:hypothetical protein